MDGFEGGFGGDAVASGVSGDGVDVARDEGGVEVEEFGEGFCDPLPFCFRNSTLSINRYRLTTEAGRLRTQRSRSQHELMDQILSAYWTEV